MNPSRSNSIPSEGWSVVQLNRSLAQFTSAWDKLNAIEFGDHPLLHSSFVNKLLQQFGSGNEVLALRGPAQCPTAMCILDRHRTATWRSFMPGQAQISPTLVSRSEQLRGLVEALPGLALQVDLLCIDPLISRLWAGEGVRLACVAHEVTIGIDLHIGLENWLSHRPSQLRKNLRNYEKRAQTAGISFHLKVVEEAEDIEAAVLRYAALEGKGWKGEAGTALASSEAQLHFYVDLLTAASAWKGASVYELWAGEQLAASRLILSRDRWNVILKTTFDESLRDYAPGRVLLLHVIQDAFARWPRARLEFYTNASQDQLAWVDEQRTIQHFTLYRSIGVEQIATLAQSLRRQGRTNSSPELPAEVTLIRVADQPDASTLRLFDTHERVHFQLGLDWWRLYVNTITQESRGDRLLALRRGGHTLAVLPANVDDQSQSLGCMVGALSNVHTALYALVHTAHLSGPDLIPLIARLLQEAPKGSVLRFEPLDPHSPSFQILESALRGAGLLVQRYPCRGNWCLPVSGNWERHRQNWPVGTQDLLEKMNQQLASAGARTEVAVGEAASGPALQAFDALFNRAQKPTDQAPGFMASLARLAARRGWLRLGLVWLDERPIAAQLCVVADGRASIFEPATDGQFGDPRWSIVLTAALVRHAIEVDRVLDVEYVLGDAPIGHEWMTHRHQQCGLTARRVNSLSSVIAAAGNVLASVWRRLSAT